MEKEKPAVAIPKPQPWALGFSWGSLVAGKVSKAMCAGVAAVGLCKEAPFVLIFGYTLSPCLRCSLWLSRLALLIRALFAPFPSALH